MEEIKKYRAVDGAIFDNPTDCMNHENATLELMTYVMAIKDYCTTIEQCEKCPLWNRRRQECVCCDDVPANWE